MDIPFGLEKPSFENRMAGMQYVIAQVERLKYLYMVEKLAQLDPASLEHDPDALEGLPDEISHVETELATFVALEIAGFDVIDDTIHITTDVPPTGFKEQPNGSNFPDF